MTAEWPHPLALEAIPAAGLRLSLSPSEAQRAAIARRLGLLALHAMSATLELTPGPGGRIAVRGLLRAEVEQECVVTLAPLRAQVEEPVAWRLLPPGEEASDGDDDPDDIECPEGVADLGEELVQELSLALDPYPRAPGAALPEEGAGDGPAHPFAALARLRPPS